MGGKIFQCGWGHQGSRTGARHRRLRFCGFALRRRAAERRLSRPHERAISRAGGRCTRHGARGGAEPGDTLTVTVADLTSYDGWPEAVDGCDYGLHVASPFPPDEPNNANKVIVPAGLGTCPARRAARKRQTGRSHIVVRRDRPRPQQGRPRVHRGRLDQRVGLHQKRRWADRTQCDQPNRHVWAHAQRRHLRVFGRDRDSAYRPAGTDAQHQFSRRRRARRCRHPSARHTPITPRPVSGSSPAAMAAPSRCCKPPHILRDWSGLKSVIGAPVIGDVLRPCDRKAKTVLGFTPGPDRRSAPRDCRKPGPLRSRTASVRPPPNDPAGNEIRIRRRPRTRHQNSLSGAPHLGAVLPRFPGTRRSTRGIAAENNPKPFPNGVRP